MSDALNAFLNLHRFLKQLLLTLKHGIDDCLKVSLNLLYLLLLLAKLLILFNVDVK